MRNIIAKTVIAALVVAPLVIVKPAYATTGAAPNYHVNSMLKLSCDQILAEWHEHTKNRAFIVKNWKEGRHKTETLYIVEGYISDAEEAHSLKNCEG